MPKKIPKSETRTLKQLREHYRIEKKLANRLRNSNKKERRCLYSKLYDELFQQVPNHPQLTQKFSSKARAKSVCEQMGFLKRFLNPKSIFLEVGSGDCSLAFKVSKFVKKTYAVDVSEDISKHSKHPKNFELIISDGSSIPVPKNSINIIYSNQLMEHLHPGDALEQLRNIYNALAINGIYICITPNRFYGPSDISAYFDEVATGFHLKEYTIKELSGLFKTVGFSKVQVMLGYNGFFLLLPVFPFRLFEGLLNKLPLSLCKKLSRWLPVRQLLGIKLVGTKEAGTK